MQPRGDRTFTINRPSTVEAIVNGQPVRRIRLDPGTYNVRDFPFAQGANDVVLQVEDDAGRRETIEFSIFFDRSLLAPGLTEFGLYAGVLAPRTRADRDYQFDEPAASGFFRRGISDVFTAGANFNIQKRGGIVGFEGVWASPIGTVGADVAISRVNNIGTGFAVNASYQQVLRATQTSFGLTAEYRSPGFANPSDLVPFNRIAWDLTATIGQALFRNQFVTIVGRYSTGRNGFPDERSVRLTYGWRINSRLSLNADALYEDSAFRNNELGVRLRLTYRLGQRTNVSAEYDLFGDRAGVGISTLTGQGVGSLALSGNVDVGDNDVGVNGNATYISNRADVGLDHATLFDRTGTRVDTQRTLLRFSTALVFADANVTLSRPIYDSFVMARTHRTLGGASVVIEPNGEYYSARSDFLGPAVLPNLSSYIPRVVPYDVPNAPPGYDVGEGNARVLPPYRSGYLVTVGSDYSVTAIGALLDENGQPVSLLAGRAVELAAPDREPVTIFTNRAGRFGISGLRSGRWQIDMPTEPPTS